MEKYKAKGKTYAGYTTCCSNGNRSNAEFFHTNGKVTIAQAKTTEELSNPVLDKDGTTWDCIWFRNYYQSDKEGKLKDPIKWKVLSVDGNDAFLLADKALDQMSYCLATIIDEEPDQ